VGEGEGPVRAEDMTTSDDILAERPEVVAARHEARTARGAFDDELDRLEASARAAVDFPAKIRRNPVRTAGVAAGAGFLLVGGPVRVLRGARNAIFGKPDPLPKSMLPKEIDKAVSELGTDGARVRRTIEREFADYLKEKAPERRERDLSGVTASLLSQVGRPVVQRLGRRLAEDLLSPRESSFADQLERVRARRVAGPTDQTGKDEAG
jgi:hypothetical protein